MLLDSRRCLNRLGAHRQLADRVFRALHWIESSTKNCAAQRQNPSSSVLNVRASFPAILQQMGRCVRPGPKQCGVRVARWRQWLGGTHSQYTGSPQKNKRVQTENTRLAAIVAVETTVHGRHRRWKCRQFQHSSPLCHASMCRNRWIGYFIINVACLNPIGYELPDHDWSAISQADVPLISRGRFMRGIHTR